MRFQLEQTNELLTTHSGLSLVGLLLPHLGLLCQCKSDFDHIEAFREDDFFQLSLGIDQVPSSATLRQRLDMAGSLWNSIILEESARMLKSAGAEITPSIRELVPLDIDVSPFDNSNTKKEGVSRTYKGHDGYAPIFAYLGQEGYCINTSFTKERTTVKKIQLNSLKKASAIPA